MADLPGCFSASDSINEAVKAAEESAAAWIDATLDTGETIPAPTSIEALRERREFAGWAFGVIAVETHTSHPYE